jgi:hypothetical protein
MSTGSSAPTAAAPSPVNPYANDTPVVIEGLFTKKGGASAKVNGDPAWSIDNAALGAIAPAQATDAAVVAALKGTQPDPDAYFAILTPAAGALGPATITLTGDSDVHGGAPKPVSTTCVITFVDSEAAGVTATPL